MGDVVRTTCPYCGVGCGVIARRSADGSVEIKGDPDHPANFGRLCSKGSALAETISLEGRALEPTITGKSAEWDDALDRVANAFSTAIAEHGPDSVALYVSGQLLTEDYYVANKLMKGFIGSANIDTNSRLCMSSSVAGHVRAFGSDTVPGTYEDLEDADLVVLTGSNLAWCHPVLYQRIAAAKERRGSAMNIVVIDPRRTATCDIADTHLAIRPDSDVPLFLGLLAYLGNAGAVDCDYVARHTSGFPAALDAARSWSRSAVAMRTGLTSAEVEAFYALFTRTAKTVTCYSQGVNQSSVGTDKVNAIINCHLATGRIGRPGMGPFSLTGQPNAMGGREVGGLANMLAAHMSLDKPQDRDRVQRFWNAPRVADRPGLKAVDLFEAVASGRIKALWIMSTNPVVSMPDADRVREAITACPFVVVSDLFATTETARLADVFLPATGWGEKNGTVTNSERRISRQRAFLPVPGQARPDWWQLAEVGRRMGFATAFSYESPADIFAEHAALSTFENDGARDFDIGAYAGVDAEAYAAMTPFSWPRPADGEGNARFFSEGGFYTADRKARFVDVTSALAAKPLGKGAFTLNTGRVRDQWHTMTRTGRSATLSAHLAEPFVEIHPSDASENGISPAGLVRVSGEKGDVILRALVTNRQARGSLFVPMHWSGEFSGHARVDALVPPVVDPVSGQPASKQSRATIRCFKVTTYGFMVSRDKPDFGDLAYWATARTAGGWRSEIAADAAVEDWAQWLRDSLALRDELTVSSYSDRVAGVERHVFFNGDKLVAALYLACEPVAVARNWIVSQLASDGLGVAERLSLSAGRPGGGQKDPGATVCACYGIGINQIVDAVHGGCHSVNAVGDTLGAGTNCGSCRAEIGRIINGCLVAAAE
ncbi:nitrate reductase [Pseudohoeflea suaedae]|uniref:Nitrate reductase n=1 Tax=Pseudohoeflea suaedae TaxID=877384 RepID=A0A4R5PIT9_9HYPH|nr:nitrate reductase [Pseudohoeflea suaedae]TDH35159.1 nitrate reductase [Pseudohoeflea suaedae]